MGCSEVRAGRGGGGRADETDAIIRSGHGLYYFHVSLPDYNSVTSVFPSPLIS